MCVSVFSKLLALFLCILIAVSEIASYQLRVMNYDFGVVFNIHESGILCGSFKISRQIEACRGQSNTASFLKYLVISDGLELNYFL